MIKRRTLKKIVVISILLIAGSFAACVALAYAIIYIEDWEDRFNECAQVTRFVLSGELDSPHLEPVQKLNGPKHLKIPITAQNASYITELSQGISHDFVRLFWAKDGTLRGQPGKTLPYWASRVVRVPNKYMVLASIFWGSDDHIMRECDLATGKQSRFIRESTLALQFSPDRQVLVINNGYGVIYLLAPPTYEKRDIIDASNNRDRLRSSMLALSPSGTLIAFGTSRYYYEDATVYGEYEIEIWDMKSRKKAVVLGGLMGEISALAFSQDGKVRVWGIPAP